MQIHPLVVQLRFARGAFARGLEGVGEEDALCRFMPMNSISWMVGHLANQEHYYWVVLAQHKNIAPGLNERVGYGMPANTPPLKEMWEVWHTVTAEADLYLDTLTSAMLPEHLSWEGKPTSESIGTRLLRNTYHYWYHTGESAAVRQMLGHTNLPEFVGDMSTAVYRGEN